MDWDSKVYLNQSSWQISPQDRHLPLKINWMPSCFLTIYWIICGFLDVHFNFFWLFDLFHIFLEFLYPYHLLHLYIFYLFFATVRASWRGFQNYDSSGSYESYWKKIIMPQFSIDKEGEFRWKSLSFLFGFDFIRDTHHKR